MTTVRKNGKEYKSVFQNIKTIISYSLSNNFSGNEVKSITDFEIKIGRLTKNNGLYTLNVHSNQWYKIEVVS